MPEQPAGVACTPRTDRSTPADAAAGPPLRPRRTPRPPPSKA
jgi:hypothetical protein